MQAEAPVSRIRHTLSMCIYVHLVDDAKQRAWRLSTRCSCPNVVQDELVQWEQGVLRDKGSLVMKILEGTLKLRMHELVAVCNLS